MKKEIKIPINHYLREEDRKKKNSAYYGEFFVSKEFDDGWRENLQERFRAYYENFQNSNLDLEVFDEKESISGNIKLILSVDKIVGNSEKDLLDVTTKLQREFLFTPVFQSLNFGVSDESVLPVVLEEPEKNSKEYNRFKLQEVIARILFLEGEINRLEYLMKISSGIDDEIRQIQLSQISDLISSYKDEIENMTVQKNDIIEKYYFSNVLISNGNTKLTSITNTQADAVIDLSENNTKKNGLKILSWMREMEELHKGNLDLSKKLSDKFDFQTDKIFSEIKELIGSAGLEVQSKNGILTNFDLDSNYNILKAKIVGVKNSEVYFLNGKLYGLEIDGITEDIKNIKVINYNKEYVFLFKAELFSGVKIICILDGNKYKVLEINGEKEFHNYYDLKYNNGSLVNGYVELKNGKNKYFYLEDGEYKFLEIEGENDFDNIDIQGKGDEYIYGVVRQSNGLKKYFYLEDGKCKFLEIEGIKEFNGYYFLKENNGIPLNGRIELENGKYSYFYLENGKYKFLESEVENEFDDIDIEGNGDEYIYGVVRQSNGLKKYFYLENGEYKFLEIEGIKEFIFFHNLETENGVPKSGEVKLEDGKYSYFYLENGEYKFLEVEGEYQFYGLDDFNIIDGKLVYGIIELENGKIKYFYLHDGKYKIFEIDGIDEFDNWNNLGYKNGIIHSGNIKLSNGNRKYFYLEDGKYIYLNIEGKDEFNSFHNIKIENGVIKRGEVGLEKGKNRYFYLENGKYIYLNIEGKTEFKNIYNIEYSDGKVISGKIEWENGDESFFYLDNGNYVFVKTFFGKYMFYKISIIEGGDNFKVNIYNSKNSWYDEDKVVFYKENGKVKSNITLLGFKKNIDD